MCMPVLKHNRKILLVMVLLFLFALQKEVIMAADTRQSWQAEWNKTVAAAKQEGSVVISTVNGLSDLFQEFQTKYPDIKVVEGMRGSVAQRTQVLLAERRAGKYLFDISIGSPLGTMIDLLIERTILDPIGPAFILPEVTDPRGWWRGKHFYMDSKGQYFFVFGGTVRSGNIIYNTKLVNPNEVTTYWDLLKEKWRGKIVLADPRDPATGGTSGVNLMFFYHHPDLGPEYIRKLLADMDATVSRDYTQMLDWIGKGKFALNFFGAGVEDAMKQGLPVKEFTHAQFREAGLLGPSRGVISLVNRAPHPNAAKVFINWILSREGQAAFQRLMVKVDADSANSMREDIPKDVIPLEYRRIGGFKYLEATHEMYRTRPKISEFVQKVLNEGKR